MPTTRNPATGETIADYPTLTSEQLDATLDAAVAAQRDWARRPVAERTATLIAIADRLRARADECARLITAEMGKPITQARSEVEKSAVTLEYDAGVLRPARGGDAGVRRGAHARTP